MLFAVNPYHASLYTIALLAGSIILAAVVVLLYDYPPWRWRVFRKTPTKWAPGSLGLDVPFPIQGMWTKTYTWNGQPGQEIAEIKGDGYYLKDETKPRHWLRDVAWEPGAGKVQFTMVSVRDGKPHDTETLVLSRDQRSMSGRSATSGLEVRYERVIEDTVGSGA
jgi:hypothetical protein